MMYRLPVSIFVLVAGVIPATAADESPNYNDHVRPIFRQHCTGCHNGDRKTAGLDLTSYRSVLSGSSGGIVVKPGVPDTSRLYESIVHADGVKPMPPNKPRLPDAQIRIVHEWIAGGLLEAKGGKSKLRSVDFRLAAGSINRPQNPAQPKNLPPVILNKTLAPPPILALASSPWADVIAVSGHEQILLYGERPPAVESRTFEQVAKKSLLWQRDFDEQPEKGKIGAAWFTNRHRELKNLSRDFLVDNGAFSFSAWIKPADDVKGGTIFGRYSFAIFLEQTRGGWRLRAVSRSRDNRIGYFGRQGVIPAGGWQHIAVTCDGKEWAFFYGGTEVARQSIPDDHVGFIKDNRFFYLAGDGHHEDRQFRGGLDDVRIYNRALTPDEIITINRNVAPSMTHIGTLPFPEGDVHDLRFSRNGALLLAAGGRGAESGKVAIFDVKTGQRKATIADEEDIVLSADMSADHRLVAIGTTAKRVKIFSAQNGQQLYRIDKHTDWVTAVRFSPDGKFLATGDRNGGIHVWETENAGIVYTLDEHKMKVTSLSWRADGDVLASAAEDGKFVLWDMKDGWATRTASPHRMQREPARYTRQTGIVAISFARDGRFLTLGRDRTLRVWKTDGTSLGEFRNLDALPTRATFTQNGQRIVVGDIEGRLQIRDAAGSVLQILHP